MPRPPYMNFPFPISRASYGIQRNPHNPNSNIINNNPSFNTITSPNNNFLKNSNSEKDDRNCAQKNKSNKYNDDYLFDLFGLKIYSDDVLLVSLIYFLYSEDVKDDGLFIVLILLLLS